MHLREILNQIIDTTDDETVRKRAIEVLQSLESSHVSRTGFGDRVIIKVQRKVEIDDNINP